MRWSPGPGSRDLLLALGVTGVAQAELLIVAPGPGLPIGSLVANLVILPAFILRRSRPVVSAVIAGVGLMVPVGGDQVSGVATPFLALLFLLASLGWYASLRGGLVGTVMVLAGGAIPLILWDGTPLADLVVNVVIICSAWAAGHLVRRASDLRVAAEIATDRATRDAVLAERARIARDLHDSMGHALTLISLQAGGTRERTAEPSTRELLAGIESTARTAMSDLHRLLRLAGREGDEALGVSAITDLVEDVRRSDLEVAMRVDLPEVVPATVSTAVYRVVQEALTNIVRHSDARAASVDVSRDGDGHVVVIVRDGGRPRSPQLGGSGLGIRGLQERLALLGGWLEAGPSSGGWRLKAVIPWAPA